jgi:hypothetical protein
VKLLSRVPQGSGPLLFIIYINDLPTGINYISDVTLFADTCVLGTNDDYDDFKQKLNLALSYINQWFIYLLILQSIDHQGLDPTQT